MVKLNQLSKAIYQDQQGSTWSRRESAYGVKAKKVMNRKHAALSLELEDCSVIGQRCWDIVSPALLNTAWHLHATERLWPNQSDCADGHSPLNTMQEQQAQILQI